MEKFRNPVIPVLMVPTIKEAFPIILIQYYVTPPDNRNHVQRERHVGWRDPA
jgi:hypothetical protein